MPESMHPGFDPQPHNGGPLYMQVKRALERQILVGELREGDFLPPEPELCRQFLVSSITVRRALMELVRDGLIRRKGGVGTVVAATRRRLRFGLLFVGFDDSDWVGRGEIFGSLLAGIGDAAWRANADFSTIRVSTTEDVSMVLKVLVDERRFDGLLLRTAGDVPEGIIDLLESRAMPYVVIKRHIEGRPMNFVTLDDAAVSRAATEHLIQLGHARIGLIMGALDISPRRQILAGYRQALEAHGLAYDPALVQALAEPALPTQADGFRAMRALVALADRPTAACIDGGEMTIGAFDALAEAGLRIPSDMAVVGYGDLRLAAALRPALTVIETSYTEIGRMAAATLFDLIARPADAPRQVMLKPPLIIRGSTGPARSASRTASARPHPLGRSAGARRLSADGTAHALQEDGNG